MAYKVPMLGYPHCYRHLCYALFVYFLNHTINSQGTGTTWTSFDIFRSLVNVLLHHNLRFMVSIVLFSRMSKSRLGSTHCPPWRSLPWGSTVHHFPQILPLLAKLPQSHPCSLLWPCKVVRERQVLAFLLLIYWGRRKKGETHLSFPLEPVLCSPRTL